MFKLIQNSQNLNNRKVIVTKITHYILERHDSIFNLQIFPNTQSILEGINISNCCHNFRYLICSLSVHYYTYFYTFKSSIIDFIEILYQIKYMTNHDYILLFLNLMLSGCIFITIRS